MSHTRIRLITLIVSLLTAVVVIALLARLLPTGAAVIALDINRSTWPLTVQNILWLAFFASFAVEFGFAGHVLDELAESWVFLQRGND